MPTISDPGFRLMRDAIAEGIEVSVIPGPSAVTMAVALSGLPTDRFSFEGFPPRTAGARLATFEKLRFEERTMVFFESPHRILESLEDAASVLGSDRQASVSAQEPGYRDLGRQIRHGSCRGAAGNFGKDRPPGAA